MIHPVDKVEWVDGRDLNPNDWNPNVVMKRELGLLERSLVRHGWVSPILVREDLIVDGYHRWYLSQTSDALIERDQRKLPVVKLCMELAEALAMTVAMNRARGHHQGQLMRTLVRRLVHNEKKSRRWVSQAIGAIPGELDLLLGDAVMVRAKEQPGFSEAWEPRRE